MSDASQANWTIKGMSIDDRRAFVAAAGRAGLSIAAWMSEAGRAYLDRERRTEVLAPEPPIHHEPVNRFASGGQPVDRMAELEGLVRMAVALTPPGKNSKPLQAAKRAVTAQLDQILARLDVLPMPRLDAPTPSREPLAGELSTPVDGREP